MLCIVILCHVKLSLSEGLQHDNNIYDTNNIACAMRDVHRDFSIVVGLQPLSLSDSYLSCVCLHRSVASHLQNIWQYPRMVLVCCGFKDHLIAFTEYFKIIYMTLAGRFVFVGHLKTSLLFWLVSLRLGNISKYLCISFDGRVAFVKHFRHRCVIYNVG